MRQYGAKCLVSPGLTFDKSTPVAVDGGTRLVDGCCCRQDKLKILAGDSEFRIMAFSYWPEKVVLFRYDEGGQSGSRTAAQGASASTKSSISRQLHLCWLTFVITRCKAAWIIFVLSKPKAVVLTALAR
jgi:hypothetical protein